MYWMNNRWNYRDAISLIWFIIKEEPVEETPTENGEKKKKKKKKKKTVETTEETLVEKTEETPKEEEPTGEKKKKKKKKKKPVESEDKTDEKEPEPKKEEPKKEANSSDEEKKKKKKKKKVKEEAFEDNSSDDESGLRQDSTADLKVVQDTTPSSPISREGILKEGWLEKKGVIRHNWTKRWMVLQGNQIKYFQKENDPKGPRGSISLVNADLYPHVQKKKVDLATYFNIRVNDRDFLIRASDIQSKEEWISAIKKGIVKDEGVPEKRTLVKKTSFLGVVKK